MARDNRPIVIVVLIIAVLVFFSNTGFFGITLLSPQVQYYNKPIEARFQSNLTSPTVTAFFNDIELFEIQINTTTNETIDTGQTIVYTQDIVNQTFILRLMDVKQAGIFKFVAKQGNLTDIETIEVRQPFVAFTHDIPILVSKGDSANIILKTQNPQGESLEADSVDIIVFDPDDKQETLTLSKSGDTFTVNFNYEKAGGYQFKVQPRKEGFATVERTVLTNVITTGGIHPVVWIWIVALVVWILLFAVRRFRR